jgi:PST family polysaccharide transporter
MKRNIYQIIKNHLKKLRPENRLLFENSFFLFILQAVSYLLPLATLPYLARILEPEKFGIVAFAQSTMQIFILFTDFGFSLSATREISIFRDDINKISRTVSTIYFIKILFTFLCFLAIIVLTSFIAPFRNDKTIYFYAFGMVIGNLLFPNWFFLGMERMKYITLLSTISRALFTLLIFIFVKNQSDFRLVPLINSFGLILSGVIGIGMMINNFKIQLNFPNKREISYTFKSSFQFFLSRISASLYTSCNVFFLGLFGNDVITGYYAAAEKLYIAIRQLYDPINLALYPYMSKNKNISFFKKLFISLTLINLLFCVFLLIFKDKIILLIFGIGFEQSSIFFNIFIFALIVVVPSVLLGYPFLAALNQEKYANGSIIIGSIFHLIILGIILFVLQKPYWIATLLVITESLVLLIRIIGVKRERLWV